jgi:hypothetical protein
MIEGLHREFKERGIRVCFAAVGNRMDKDLRRAGLVDKVGRHCCLSLPPASLPIPGRDCFLLLRSKDFLSFTPSPGGSRLPFHSSLPTHCLPT